MYCAELHIRASTLRSIRGLGFFIFFLNTTEHFIFSPINSIVLFSFPPLPLLVNPAKLELGISLHNKGVMIKIGLMTKNNLPLDSQQRQVW